MLIVGTAMTTINFERIDMSANKNVREREIMYYMYMAKA